MSSAPVPHAAFGCTLSSLDVVVVEDSKPMQLILRSLFNAAKIARLRVYDDAGSALEAMLTEPPNLVITDWNMAPINGYQLIRTLRSARMKPLCYVPIIVITAHATHRAIDKLVRAGAHLVVVKPFSPTQLLDRVTAVLEDDRPLTVDAETGMVQIKDMLRILDAQAPRWKAVEAAREFHKSLSERPRVRPAEDPATKSDKPEPKTLGEVRPAQVAVLARRILEMEQMRANAAQELAKRKGQPEPAGGLSSRRKNDIAFL